MQTTHLVQILLPLYTNDKAPLDKELFVQVRNELVERFGGLTAYNRNPAHGLWQADDGQTTRDDLVVYEVMTKQLDEQWWRQYRVSLETRFQQEALIVRAQEIRIL
jgi:hypothetical protein